MAVLIETRIPNKRDTQSVVDLYRQEEIGCSKTELNICHLISAALETRNCLPFFVSNEKNAIGLRRDLETHNFREDGQLVGHLDEETTRGVRIELLQMSDLKEIIDYSNPSDASQKNAKDWEFKKMLFSLLRRVDLLHENVTVDKIHSIEFNKQTENLRLLYTVR